MRFIDGKQVHDIVGQDQPCAVRLPCRRRASARRRWGESEWVGISL